MRASRLLRDPVLHFLLIGVGLFVAYGVVSPDRIDGERIVVTQAAVDDLTQQFRSRWSRLPTADELASLVENHVRDEVLYREGVALGLDRDDPVIKRRVRQKVELIAEEALSVEAPSDDQLQAFMVAHPERFRRPPQLSFEQVFIGADRPPAEIDAAVYAAREALARGADPATLGVPTLLPRRFERLALDRVARDFGAGFAERLQALPVGSWSDAVRSGFGVHVLRVTEVEPAELPPLEAVRAVVAREWELERRRRTNEDGYRRMRARYAVSVEANLPAAQPAPPRARP